MRFDDQNESVDLRLLSLLHALRDTEEFKDEAKRLYESHRIDDSTWQKLCSMGRDLGLGDVLNGTHNDGFIDEDGADHTFDRRKQERRVQCRRINSDRREQDRRTNVIPWVGLQRRKHARRQTD